MSENDLFDLQAERHTLGACLLDNEMIDPVRLIVWNRDFWRPQHGLIFGAIGELWLDETPVDLTTLEDKLRQNGKLEEIGGRLYLVSLKEETPSALNGEHYAKIVRSFSIRRQLMNVGREVSLLAKDMTVEPEEVLEKANEKLYSLSNLGSEPVFLSAIFPEVLFRAENGIFEDYRTDYPDIDKICCLQKGQLLVIAGETRRGKTTFALDLAHRFCKAGHPVLIFSLEMSSLEIAQRYLSKAARVSYLRYAEGNLNEWDKKRLAMAIAEAQQHKNFPGVVDKENVGIDDLFAYTRPYFRKRTEKPGVLIVDYIQLVSGPKKENRNQEVAYVVRRLKHLARQQDILVIGLSQLSRNINTRKDRKPELSDLRESGEIEQTADMVWFLYKTASETRLEIAKQRNGPDSSTMGEVILYFRPEFVSFESALSQPAEAR